MVMTKFSINKNFFKYIYFKEIYLEPNLPYKLLFIYRIIIGLFFTYCAITNNEWFFLELLNSFSINYVFEFNDECCLNINRWGSAGQGSSRNPGFSSGGSGGPPDPKFTGSEPVFEVENSKRRREDNEESAPKKRGRPLKQGMLERLPPKGPKFCYFDAEKNRAIHPECFHTNNPRGLGSNTRRIYDEDGLRFTYVCESADRRDHYCKITFPDATNIVIYDRPTVMKFIEFHRNEIRLGYSVQPKYFYVNHYKEHFEGFRKNKINSLMAEYKKINDSRTISRKWYYN